MTVAMGEYEISLRERAIAARRRLMGGGAVMQSRPTVVVRPYRPPQSLAPKPPVQMQPAPAPAPYEVWPQPSSVPMQTSKDIVREVMEAHGMTWAMMIGPSRSKPLVKCRQECFYRLREERGLSWTQIGLMFGYDHTTALYGYRRHLASLEASK